MVAPRTAMPRRRGFGLIELTAAGVLFVALLAVTIQVTDWVATERRAAGRREAAIRLVGNLMERALARPWADVTPASLAGLVVEANRDRASSSGRVAIEVIDAGPVDGVGQKRVVVEVAWPDLARVPEAPVRLVAWTYERKGEP